MSCCLTFKLYFCSEKAISEEESAALLEALCRIKTYQPGVHDQDMMVDLNTIQSLLVETTLDRRKKIKRRVRNEIAAFLVANDFNELMGSVAAQSGKSADVHNARVHLLRDFHKALSDLSRESKKSSFAKPVLKLDPADVQKHKQKRAEDDAKLSAEMDVLCSLDGGEYIQSRLSSIVGREWGVESSNAREEIDKRLAMTSYYYNTQEPSGGVSHCLFCYKPYTYVDEYNKPIGSHLLSRWYLDDVIQSPIAEKLAFAKKDSLEPITSPESFKMYLQCKKCDTMQGDVLENPLSNHGPIVAALSSLRHAGVMPGDDLQRPKDLYFRGTEDSPLPQGVLYKFVVCNMMRWAFYSLLRDNAASRWSFFDVLRKETQSLISAKTHSAIYEGSNDLFVYVIPIGCGLFSEIGNFYCQELLTWPSDSTTHICIIVVNGVQYIVLHAAPMIMVVGPAHIDDLHEYKIRNSDDSVNLPMIRPRYDSGARHNSVTCVIRKVYDEMFSQYKMHAVYLYDECCAGVQRTSLQTAKYMKKRGVEVAKVDSALNKLIGDDTTLDLLWFISHMVKTAKKTTYYACLAAHCAPRGIDCNAVNEVLTFEELYGFACYLYGRIIFLYPQYTENSVVGRIPVALRKSKKWDDKYRQITNNFLTHHPHIRRMFVYTCLFCKVDW